MTQEILYTSAPKGLKPGSRGFCTVVSSEGMARNLAERLEALSGYRHAFGVHDENRNQNPVNWSHTAMRIGGQEWHVLSRIADAGQDYSGRTNKLAHHIALDRNERPAGGPARILQTSGVITAQWNEQVEIIPCRRLPSIAEPNAANCPAWKRWTGDAGWAGQVAEYVSSQASPASVIFPAGCPDTLELVSEVLDLLLPEKRWQVTFSTYFTQLVPGTKCRLRFVLDGTSEATSLRNHPHAFVVDLCSQLTEATGGDLVAAARSGVLPFNGSVSRTPPVDEGEIEDEVTFASADDVVVSSSMTQAKKSFDHDGEESYRLQSSESHEDAYGRPKRPPELRGKQKTRSRSRSRRKPFLIVGGVLAGVALLIVAFIFVFPMGRQSVSPEIPPGDSLAASNHVAGSQPQGHEPGLAGRSTSDTGTKIGVEADTANASEESTGNAADSDSANGSKQNSSQGKDKQGSNVEIASQRASPENGSNNAGAKTATDASKTMRTDSKPAESPAGKLVASAEAASTGKELPKETPRVEVEQDPFAELPRTKDRSMYEILLPLLGTAGGTDNWKICTREKLKLELPGASILVGATGGQAGDPQSPASGIRLSESKPNTWVVEWFRPGNVPGEQKIDEFGTFTVSGDGDFQTLRFKRPTSAPPEAGLLRWAILKLSVGERTAVCRLGRPIHLPPVTLDDNSKPGEFTIESGFEIPKEVLPLCRSAGTQVRVLARTLSEFPAVSSRRGPAEFQAFRIPFPDSQDSDQAVDPKKDRHVELRIFPTLDEKDLRIELQADAFLNVYSEEELITIQQNLNSGIDVSLTPPMHSRRMAIKSRDEKKLREGRKSVSPSEEQRVIAKLAEILNGAMRWQQDAKEKIADTKQSDESKKRAEADKSLADKLIEQVKMQQNKHQAGTFGKLKESIKRLKGAIAASSLSLSLVLDLPDGKDTRRVVVAEDGGAAE